MNLVIMQPYLFPYLGYIQLLAAADRFVVYDDVNYIKGGWINRNRLLSAGAPSPFVVPLEKASPNRKINDIQLDQRKPWKRKLLQTIEQNYRRSKSFGIVFPLIQEVIESNEETISGLAVRGLQMVKDYLQLPVEIVPTSTHYGNEELSGPSRVIDICKIEGATKYINAPGGKSLYNSESFKAENIDLKFLVPTLPRYSQGLKEGAFLPGLSIIDALMFNELADMKTMLYSFSLED